MKYSLLIFLLTSWFSPSPAPTWQTPFERGAELESATYAEAIHFYERLAASDPAAKLLRYGLTDAGEPLHLLVLSEGGEFDPKVLRDRGKPVLLINNGIHAGEPCGIDASMMLARDLLKKQSLRPLLDQVIIAIVPVYNIGGALNRNSYSRANQIGPKEYGFRGNARNYDLNRDCIKADSRNMKAFSQLFQDWRPEVFIDTHTTNGADYPATLTYIASHPATQSPQIKEHMETAMIPAMEAYMTAKDIGMCPYINPINGSPENGLVAFLDGPRYTTGYATLFQSMSFVTEAHMLKTFSQRVWGTYHFLSGMIDYLSQNGSAVVTAIAQDRAAVKSKKTFAVDWQLDRNRRDSLWFSGYEATYETSKVSGQQRLRYDPNQPYERFIPYYRHYEVSTEVETPFAYLIPQAEYQAIDLLQLNGVEMSRLQRDTTLAVEVGYLEDVQSAKRSYEGHFVHQQLELRREEQTLHFRKGDWVIFPNQERNAYLVHVLEPKSRDSFFRWNYFDGVLMQKEYFSPYLFEDEAAEMLANDPQLREAFETRKRQDTIFASEPYFQLTYLYKRSPHYESTYQRYPITFLRKNIALPLEGIAK